MTSFGGNNNNQNPRYVWIYLIIYLISIVLVIALFNLQIIKGDAYRKQSENRLLREKEVQAPRGEIYDRNGTLLVTNEMGFNLLLYKTKIEDNNLNTGLLKIINILELNEDKYANTLPIEINENGEAVFTFDEEEFEEEEKEWKEKYKYDNKLTAYDVLMKLKEKYKIEQEDINEIRKIAGIRFDITKAGYSAYSPYQIASNISRDSTIQIEEQNPNFPGINISTVPIRSYIRDSIAAHILGYTGQISKEELEANDTYGRNDEIGKTGMEYVLEKYLRGSKGTKKVEMDSSGRINEEYEVQESIKGNDVILTIDANLQEAAEKALATNIEKIATGGFSYQYEDANAGAVVAIDVNTGEILAMASYPTYDPSVFVGGISSKDWKELNTNVAKPMYNRAIQAAYAPGSTFKMITALAGLESGTITPYEEIYDAGIYDKGHKPRCWYYSSYGMTHGNVNVSGAIKTSCNYFFYEVGYRMGIDTLAKYARYYGLGEKTGIELPGEIKGTLASREYSNSLGNTWYVADTLSAAIGQSYNSFTPIQLARYVAMIANGGKAITPTLIKDVVTVDGLSVDKTEVTEYVNNKLRIENKEIEKYNIASANAKAVLEGMKDVTDDVGGTAYGMFSSLPVTVGGKTGTAEAGSGSNNGVFVGFAPYEKPEIAVVVIVEHGGHGSYTGNVVKDVIAEYCGVNSKKITEDKKVSNLGITIE